MHERIVGRGSIRARSAARWVAGALAPCLALVLAAAYVAQYVADPNRPGQDPVAPLGWLGWFDQSVSLRSVAALAAGNLSASQYHYPLGYTLLGLPGYWIAPEHAFFPVGLVSLLCAYWAYVSLSRRLGVPAAAAAALFCLVTLTDQVLFRDWVLPWNTTPVAALLWALLAAMAAWVAGRRRPVSIGLMLGLLAACRPTEAAIVAIPLAAGAVADVQAWRRGGRLPLGEWIRLAIASAAIVGPVIGLHLAIYGPHPSLYMQSSKQIGFTLHDIAWKAYVILADPYSWFKDGTGLLQHRPWYALGIAGVLQSLFGGAVRRMLGLTLAAHALLYVSYVDLLPTGLFRYMNVHYFMWAVPGYALLASLLLRDLVRPGGARLGAAGALAAAAVLLGVRLDPKEAGDARAVKAVDFDGPLPPFQQAYFGTSTLLDSIGPMANGVAMRVFVYPTGIRVMGLQRDIVGPVRWVAGMAPPGFEGAVPARRLVIGLRWTWRPPWWHREDGPRIPVPNQ